MREIGPNDYREKLIKAWISGQKGPNGYIYMTKLYGYDRNDDGIILNKRIYCEHPKQDSNSNI